MNSGFPYGNMQTPYAIPKQEVIRVSGRAGASAFAMGPNSSVLLMDETQPVVWLKTTDSACYPTLTGYPLGDPSELEKEEVPVSAFDSIASRLESIERRLDELSGKSDASTAGSRATYSPNVNSRSGQKNSANN